MAFEEKYLFCCKTIILKSVTNRTSFNCKCLGCGIPHDVRDWTQVLKKLPAFYVNRMFITVFTRAGHWPLSCVSRSHSTWPHLWSILILFPHLPLLLRAMYCMPFSRATCPVHRILLYCVPLSCLPACYMPRPSHPILLGYSNTRPHIQCSLSSCISSICIFSNVTSVVMVMILIPRCLSQCVLAINSAFFVRL
jgi:hypothetical protein